MRYLKDVFLTEDFLVKGHVNTGGQRLTTFLNSTPKRFVEVNEATLIGNVEGERIVTARLVVRLHEVLLAHELVNEAGDESLRALVERDRDQIAVKAHLGGRIPLEVSGKMRRRTYERDDLGAHDFIVISEPVIQGLTGKKPREYALLKKLPYVIVNRNRITFVLDLS